MRQLERDPFARATLVKESPQPVDCAWCGGRDGQGRCYVYRWESDGQMGSVHPRYTTLRRFCSKACWESYS